MIAAHDGEGYPDRPSFVEHVLAKTQSQLEVELGVVVDEGQVLALLGGVAGHRVKGNGHRASG